MYYHICLPLYPVSEISPYSWFNVHQLSLWNSTMWSSYRCLLKFPIPPPSDPSSYMPKLKLPLNVIWFFLIPFLKKLITMKQWCINVKNQRISRLVILKFWCNIKSNNYDIRFNFLRSMCNTPLPVFYVTIILLKYIFFSLCLNFLGVFFFYRPRVIAMLC